MTPTLTLFLRDRVPHTWPGRMRVSVVVVGAFLACSFLVQGFARWWPGCENFNTRFQQSGNAERAGQVISACPDVSAGDARIALVADMAFPLSYASLAVGIVLLLASSNVWQDKARMMAARIATLFVLAAAIDMLVENLALLVVTFRGWPPPSDAANDYLLMTAALGSWAKLTLMLIGIAGCIALVAAWLVVRVRRLGR